MLTREGQRHWKNIHVTFEKELDDLINIDNSSPGGVQLRGYELLKQAANDAHQLIKEASDKNQGIRALGSAWALTDIHIPKNWMLNTKLLNGCFDVTDQNFDPTFPSEKRPFIIVAQCGISVGELNVHLEVSASSGFKRTLRTAGIGAGQTIAGAVSGNTHGAAINFGAMPDFVVGLQLVNGTGKSIWLERASQPIMNDRFIGKIDAKLIRDDELFNAAVVSFGAFGIITAMAIETEPIYHLHFPKARDITIKDLKHRISNMDYHDPQGLHHFEFIFNPYDLKGDACLIEATKVPYSGPLPSPDPVWIIRNEDGFAPGDNTPPLLLNFPLPMKWKSKIMFDAYKKRNILSGVKGTPGQLFTATITYLEGYAESAIAVSIDDTAKMIDALGKVFQELKIPSICQVRVVHPSSATLGFTYLGPKSVVFEFGLVNDPGFKEFEDRLVKVCKANGVKYTFHWSKNSGIDPERLIEMYGEDRIKNWKTAREQLFENNAQLMEVFNNDHLRRAGLDM